MLYSVVDIQIGRFMQSSRHTNSVSACQRSHNNQSRMQIKSYTSCSLAEVAGRTDPMLNSHITMRQDRYPPRYVIARTCNCSRLYQGLRQTLAMRALQVNLPTRIMMIAFECVWLVICLKVFNQSTFPNNLKCIPLDSQFFQCKSLSLRYPQRRDVNFKQK